MNERKISVEGVRTTKWNIYQVDEFEFIKDLEGSSDIQVQKETEEINKVIGDKEIELMRKSILKATMDKPEIEDILQCSLHPISSCSLDNLGENRIINVEFLAKGLVKVLSKEKIDLINDAYCPSQPIDLIKSNHDIGLIHGMVNTEVIIKDNISLNDDKEKIGSIIMTSGSPKSSKVTI